MVVSVYRAIKFFLIILMVIAIFHSFELFFTYLIFFTITLIGDILISIKRVINVFVYQFFVLSLLIVFYLRPLLLIQNPEFFQYSRAWGFINEVDIITALWKVNLFSAILLIGFAILSPRSQLTGNLPYNQFVIDNVKKLNSSVLRRIDYVINLLIVLASLRFLINVTLGIGIKGQLITSSAAFLVRFAPEEFIVGVGLMILFFYRSTMSKVQLTKLISALGLLLLSFLATGSKAVFLLLIMFFIFISMYYQIRVKVPKLLSYVIISLILIPVSFLLGNAVKFASYNNKTDVNSVLEVFYSLLDNVSFSAIANTITGRFVGFDGVLVLGKMNQEILYESYNIINTLIRSIAMLIPFVSSDLQTTGDVVSAVVAGLPEDAVHAGAIGGLSALDLIFPGFSLLSYLIFVIINLIIVRLHFSIIDPFTMCNFLFFYVYFVLLALMSGNFDYCIAIYIIKIVLYKIYFYPVFKK